MKGIWYDTGIYPNARYCSRCKKKVANNKKEFDFEFCPYCGDYKVNTVTIDKESPLLKGDK